MEAWKAGLDPNFAWRVDYLLRVAASVGYPLRVSSGFRSRTKQAQLYSDWIAGKSTLPAAKPGRSRHEVGKAVDVVWASTGLAEPFPGAWRALGAFAENYLGLKWGGKWRNPDPVHFEV